MKNWIQMNEAQRALVEANLSLVGQTIASTRFWNNTGATIVAIHRAGRTILSPGPHAQFFAGDKLLIVGDEAAYQRAVEFMRGR